MQEIKTTNFSLKCINRVGVLINNTPAIHFHYKFEFILCKNWLYQNCLCNNKVVPKTVVENFSFSEFKIEKVKSFTQDSTKIFCYRF